MARLTRFSWRLDGKVKRKVTSFRVVSRSPRATVNGIFLPAITRLYWTINVSSASSPVASCSLATRSSSRASLSYFQSHPPPSSPLFSSFCLQPVSEIRLFFKSGDTARRRRRRRRRPGAGDAGGMRYFGIMSVDGRATG